MVISNNPCWLCVYVCVRACVCKCMCTYVCVCVCVFAIWGVVWFIVRNMRCVVIESVSGVRNMWDLAPYEVCVWEDTHMM